MDSYDGGGGEDILRTRDGNDERVACGSGSDNATTDLHDLRDSCETVDESGALEPDADRDGYAKLRPDGKPGPDCNDDDAAIRPGRDEVFGNGKDDNCDQIVDRSLDADADGFRPPLDCNDGDANIRPLATEVRGNTVDENCDGLFEPLPSLRPTIDASWDLRGFRTINRRLIAEDVEAGTTITMTCNGNKCPFKTKKWTVKAQTRRKSLRSPLKGARLRPASEAPDRVRQARPRVEDRSLPHGLAGVPDLRGPLPHAADERPAQELRRLSDLAVVAPAGGARPRARWPAGDAAGLAARQAQQLGVRVAQSRRDRVEVLERVEVADQPERHPPVVGHHGHGERAVAGQERHRIQRVQPAAEQVERELRAGDVGDEQVVEAVGEVQPRGLREQRRRREALGPGDRLGAERLL